MALLRPSGQALTRLESGEERTCCVRSLIAMVCLNEAAFNAWVTDNEP
jgi:hypothetical protein